MTSEKSILISKGGVARFSVAGVHYLDLAPALDAFQIALTANVPLPEGWQWKVSRIPGTLDAEGRPAVAEGWLHYGQFGVAQDDRPAKVGDRVRCRERGGVVTVTVEAVSTNPFTGQQAVRGLLSEESFLPVAEFLGEMEVACRKMGAPV